jgi:hypothetical protein
LLNNICDNEPIGVTVMIFEIHYPVHRMPHKYGTIVDIEVLTYGQCVHRLLHLIANCDLNTTELHFFMFVFIHCHHSQLRQTEDEHYPLHTYEIAYIFVRTKCHYLCSV